MAQGALQPDVASGAIAAKDAPSAARAIPPSRVPFGRWLWLCGPLFVLGAEVGFLTPWVEFHGGLIDRLANPGVATALFFAGVLLLLVAGEDLARLASVGRPGARLAWLAVNLVCYGRFFQLNVWLQRPDARADSSWSAACWLFLAAMVGIASVLTCFSVGTIVHWSKTFWHQAAGALVLGFFLVLITPQIQRLWPLEIVAGPATRIARAVLEGLHPGRSHVIFHGGEPTLSLGDEVKIRITRSCAEMESIAAFLLLGATLLAAQWRRVVAWRLLVVIVGGAAVLFVLNAVRLALLVEIGARFSGNLSVSLAHSRLSAMLFLCCGAGLLVVSRGWWYRRELSD